MTDLLVSSADGHGMLGRTENRYNDGLFWSASGEVAGGASDLREGRARMERTGLFATAELDEFFAYRPLLGLKPYNVI
jgi:hypothetical protein